MRGLSLVAASGGHSSSRCAGLSPSWPLLLWSTDSRRAGSVIVAHGPSCSAACGIFPDQALNPCPLNWQADSQPLRHQGSPYSSLISVHSTIHPPPHREGTQECHPEGGLTLFISPSPDGRYCSASDHELTRATRQCPGGSLRWQGISLSLSLLSSPLPTTSTAATCK